MRTTITLEPDVEILLKKAMRERGPTFKNATNEAVRDGLAAMPAKVLPFKQRTVHMSKPLIDLTKALAPADEMDDIAHGWLPSK